MREQDPGGKVRRRISFKTTNLIGSFQDDGKIGGVCPSDFFA
jgi:hypothetical protein